MSAVCPSGHHSQTEDFCDQCGAPIAGATAILPVVEEIDTSASAQREPCPVCAAPRSGDDRYCEGCGHDFLAPAPSAPSWDAIVSADRAQFDRQAVSGLTFPVDYGNRRFGLLAGPNRIGRSHGAPDEELPEIDLAAPPPVDPGISRLHAVLEAREDGTCVLRDLGSTNGTFVRDEPGPIPPHSEVPIADGDRIRLGAWTTITLRHR
jgi:hypothetical protein